MKKAIFIFCLVLCLCPNLYALASSPSISRASAVSDFTLSDLSGNSVSLSDFEGKPVILFFWTTWCPHCRRELADFAREYENLKSMGIELLTIDIGESKARIESFIKSYSAEFPILIDKDANVANKYGVVGVPTIILISKQGDIVSLSHTLPDNYQSLLLE